MAPRRHTILRNLTIRTAWIVLTCLSWAASAGALEIRTGQYVGNSSAGRTITGLGFRPVVVIVKGDTGKSGILRSATMPAGLSKNLGEDKVLLGNMITDFLDDGFTLGSMAEVNVNGTDYWWIAFAEDPGAMALGSFMGTGEPLTVSDVGFEPDYVIVMTEDGEHPYQRMSTMPSLQSAAFRNDSLKTDLIGDFTTTGFQVGNKKNVNAAGFLSHYIAWREVPGEMAVGSFVGDAASSREITTSVVQPDYVVVKSENSKGGVHRPASLTGNASLMYSKDSNIVDAILGLTPSGFTVGPVPEVNEADKTIHWAAFHEPKADLGLSVAIAPLLANVGDEVEIVVRLENAGPDAATGVAVHHALPAGLTHGSASTTAGVYDPGTGLWSLASLPMAGAAQLTITATVAVGAGGTTQTSNVSVSQLDQYDPNGANDDSSAGVRIQTADLGLAAITLTPTPRAGDLVQIGVQLQNDGPDAATGIVVSDMLPVGLTYQSHAASLGSYSPLDGVWTMATLGAGSSATLRIDTRVDDGMMGATIVDTAAVTATAVEDQNPANDQASVTFIVQAANLALGLGVNQPTPGQGEQVRFSATLDNQGPDLAQDIVVAAQLPPGLSLALAAPSQGSYDPGTGRWTLPSLLVGGTAVLVLDANVTAGAGSVVPVTMTVQSSEPGDPAPSDDAASTSLMVLGVDVAVAMDVDDALPNAGDAVVYTITVENVGGGTATGVAVADTLPAGVIFTGATPSQGSYDAGTGLWTIGTLGQGSSCVLLLSATIAAGRGGETLINRAGIAAVDQGDGNPANDSDTAPLRVQAADLAMVKNVDDPSPNIGDSVVFTLQLTNDGPDAATAVAVADTLPAGLLYESAVAGQGSYDAGTGLWTVGTVPPGETVSLDLQAQVQLDVGGGDSIVNTGRIIGADQEDPDTADNLDTATLTQQSADLSLTLEVDDPAPSAGGPVSFLLSLSNAGPSMAQGVDVLSALPSGLTYVDHQPPAEGYDPGTGLWSPGALAPGATDTLRINAVVDADRSGAVLPVEADIVAVDQPDPDGNDNADAVTITVRSADLALAMTADELRPTEGDTVRFELTVADLGADQADTAVIGITLPPELGLLRATPDMGVFDGQSGQWALSSLTVGVDAVLTIETLVSPGTVGQVLTMQAAVLSVLPGDPEADNDSASVAVTVAGADLGVSLAVNIATPNLGEPVLYTLSLTNDGPDSVDGVVVRNDLPAGIDYQSHTPPSADFDPLTGRWRPGALAPGQTLNLFVQARVGAGAPGEVFVDTLTIESSPLADPEPLDDLAVVSLRIPAADLRLDLTSDDATPATGDEVHLTLTVANDGPDPATGVVVGCPLPSGLIYLASDRPDYDQLTGRWIVGEVLFGDSAVLELTAAVSSSAAGDTLHAAAAVAEVEQGDSGTGNETATVSLVVDEDADLGLTFQPDDAAPDVGQSLEWRLRITNHGPNTATNIVVRDSLPAGVALTAAWAEGGSYDDAARLWSVPMLEAGDDLDLVLTSDVLPGEGGSDHTGAASIVSLDQHSLNPANDAVEADIHVLGANLALASYVDLQSPNEGDELIITLYLTNQGPDRATGVAVVDSLPAGLTYASHTPPLEDFVFDAAAGVWRWDVGTLEASSSRALFVRVTVDEGTTGMSFDHTTRIEPFGQEDPDPDDNVAVNTVTVGGVDLALSMIADVADPAEGDLVRFDLELANMGPNAGTGIAVLDTLPQGLQLLGTIPNGVYEAQTGIWNIGDLARGETATLTLMARVDERTGGSRIVHAASVAALDQVDPAPDNDVATTELTVAWPEQGHILISAPPATPVTAAPGEAPREVLELQLVNWSVAPDTLMTLTLANASVGAGSATQMDASWQDLSLWKREPDGSTTDLIGPRTMSAGTTQFPDLALGLAAGDTVTLIVRGAASPLARDGDLLALRCDDAEALGFTRDVLIDGGWPLASGGGLAVDGFVASQVGVHDVDAGVLPPGGQQTVVMDLELPGDGYDQDSLEDLALVNRGDARAGTDLARLELWRDDGNGVFDAGRDASLGGFVFTGDRWALTGLDEPLPVGGMRVFVTADIAAGAESGRTVRLELPVNAVAVARGNDGPRDVAVANAFEQVVSAADRIYVSVAGDAWSAVHPGAPDRELLDLAITNTYGEPRRMTSLSITNRSVSDAPGSLDDVVSGLVLRDQDGSILATASFSGGRAVFGGLDLAVPTSSTRHLRVGGDIALHGAADGDSLAVSVAGALDIRFATDADVQGDWPLSSDGGLVVDGHVVAQLDARPTLNRTVAPGEGPVLALDLTVPANGDAADILNSLRLENVGSAGGGSVASLQLWRDGGAEGFAPGVGGDELLGTFNLRGSTWYLAGLDFDVPPAGARLFVGVTTTPTLADSTVFDLMIPRDGLGFASGNDGPIDADLNPLGRLLFSEAPLHASLAMNPSVAVTGQEEILELTVWNAGLERASDVMPTIPVPTVEGIVTISPVPVPAIADLDPGESAVFRWSLTAVAVGEVMFDAAAHGTGAATGDPLASLWVTSSPLTILSPPSALSVGTISQLPFSVNRGQADITAMTLALSLDGESSSSRARVDTVMVTCVDEDGAPLASSDLLSRVVLRNGSDVLGVRAIVSGDGPVVPIILDEPLEIRVDQTVLLTLALDVDDEAPDAVFRISLPEVDAIAARDVVSGLPIAVLPSAGTFPLQTEAAHIVAGAEDLLVVAVAGAAVEASRGQDDVRALVLGLHNSGSVGNGAGIQLGSLAIQLVDDDGMPLASPASIVTDVSVTAGDDLLGSITLPADAAADLMVEYDTPLTLAAGEDAVLTIVLALTGDAPAPSLRLATSGVSGWDARDENSGVPVSVVTTPSLLMGPNVSILDPVELVHLGGSSQGGFALTGGATDLPVLAVAIRHPIAVGTSAASLDTLTIQARTPDGQALRADTMLDSVCALWNDDVVARSTALSSPDGRIDLVFNAQTIAAGSKLDLVIAASPRAVAVADSIVLLLAPEGIVASDIHLHAPVEVTADAGIVVPLSTGPRILRLPSDELRLSWSGHMPAVLSPMAPTTSVADLVLTNPAAAPAGDLVVASLGLMARNGGLEIPVGASVRRIIASIDGIEWAVADDLGEADTLAVLTPLHDLRLAAGESAMLELMVTLHDAPAASSLEIGLGSELVSARQDEGDLVPVRILAVEGESFPFWTDRGTVSLGGLDETYSNFPNPFAAGRETTRFVYALSGPATVTLRLFTARGEMVVTVVDAERRTAGLHQDDAWDGRNGRGAVVRNGVYIAEIVVEFDGGERRTLRRKVAVVR